MQTFDFDTYSGSGDFNINDFCNIDNMSALLNLIIPRYKRLVDNNKFIKSKRVIENLMMYMSMNDGVAKWYFANDVMNKTFSSLNKLTSSLFKRIYTPQSWLNN